jgi:hypothetical protein
MVNRTVYRPRQNKANFPSGGTRPGDVGRRPIVPNKANCPKRGTEAVSGYAGRDRAWGHGTGPNAQNEPNLPGGRRFWGAGASGKMENLCERNASRAGIVLPVS